MKKVLMGLIALFVFLPMTIFAKDKVKVYVFEAGGCPYCEMEMEYLKGLSSYKDKFEIVTKELYIDHVDWENGKDYDLGVAVADAFYDKGYEDASYRGTPFVVISNIYAAAAYSTELEDIILEAYEAGDEDVVSCFEKGKDNCADLIKSVKTETTNTEKTSSPSSNAGVIAITLICTGIVVLVYLVKSYLDKREILEAINKK